MNEKSDNHDSFHSYTNKFNPLHKTLTNYVTYKKHFSGNPALSNCPLDSSSSPH